MTIPNVSNNLSNLIIAGVNKAGSTSLYHYLGAHPDICGSLDKETCYFLPLLYNEPIQDINEYRNQFLHCNKQAYRMEATPAYIYGGMKIAGEIKNTVPEAKIIIILKDPVQRLISFYQRKKTTFQLPENLSLADYVTACSSKSDQELTLKENQIFTGIALGEYDKYIEPWLEMFGKNIKILFFDDLQKDSKKFMIELSRWLKIDPSFYNDFDFDVKNKSHNYKNRIFHRIAVSANSTGQRFWRSNPGLKKALLNTYYKVNGTPFAKEGDYSKTILTLKNHYSSHNSKLRDILNKFGYSNVPAWMEREKEIA